MCDEYTKALPDHEDGHDAAQARKKANSEPIDPALLLPLTEGAPDSKPAADPDLYTKELTDDPEPTEKKTINNGAIYADAETVAAAFRELFPFGEHGDRDVSIQRTVGPCILRNTVTGDVEALVSDETGKKEFVSLSTIERESPDVIFQIRDAVERAARDCTKNE